MVERGNRGSVGVIDNVENDIVLQRVVLCVHVHSLLAWCVSVCVSVCVCVCVCRMNVEPGSRVLQWTLMYKKRKQRVSCVYDNYCDICTVFGRT